MSTDIPEQALLAAERAIGKAMADPECRTEKSAHGLARAALEAAMPTIERDIRDRIAATLRRAAEGRREYAATFGESEAQWQLLMHARGDESAAAVIENPANLLDAIPSWCWTEEEAASVRENEL